MVKQRPDMVRGSIPLCLPLLRHDITDVNFQGTGLPDGLHDTIHQQVGDDAGIQAPRRQHHHLRLPDGLHRLRQGLGTAGQQIHPADAAVLLLLALKDAGLPHHPYAVFKLRLQLDILIGHRQHPTGDGQHLTQALYRPVKTGHDAVESRQKEIAEALARQLSLREAVVHQLGHQGFGIGQRLQTVADISRRKHPQVLPQPPGAAAVVGHRDDGRDILRITLQATQQGGQARAAADGGDAGAVLRCYRLSVWLHTASLLLSGDVPMVFRDLIPFLRDVLRQLMGHRHGAMVAAGTADGDDQCGLALLGV